MVEWDLQVLRSWVQYLANYYRQSKILALALARWVSRHSQPATQFIDSLLGLREIQTHKTL